jgi:hypothetical protein
MNDNLIIEKKKPLAYGFIEKNRIYFNLKYDFIEETTFHNKLGQDLIDFAWIDMNVFSTMLNFLYGRYVLLRNKKNDYAFIAMGLIQSIENVLKRNTYFSTYLFAVIDFLLTDRVDSRILFDVSRKIFSDCENSTEYMKNYNLETIKSEIILSLPESISKKQVLIDESLERVLGNKSGDPDTSPISRLYKLEQTDEFFKTHWNSHFNSCIGRINKNTNELANLYELETIDDMFRFELIQMILNDISYKRCKCCEKLFIPKGRADSLYCARTMPGKTKPCSEIGANIIMVEKRNSNPVAKAYRQAYERLKKRIDLGYMESDVFDDWNDKAKVMCDKCNRGELSLKEFTDWLDETSRVNK